MSIGILGGTFDPPHQAHCEISIRAIEQYSLDKVLFIPSKNPWQKTVSTSYKDRYIMTNLLIEEYPSFEVSDVEAGNLQQTYTVTLSQNYRFRRMNYFLYLVLMLL